MANNAVVADKRHNLGNTLLSSVAVASDSQVVAVGTWQKQNPVYRITSRDGTAQQVCVLNSTGSVLDLTFGMDAQTLFMGSSDGKLLGYNVQTQQPMVQLDQHSYPISCMNFSPQAGAVVTASWDETVKVWDMKQQKNVMELKQKERVYAMDVSFPYCVIGLAGDRKLVTYDLRQSGTGMKEEKSPLKMMTRCVAIFTKEVTGYCVGSVEGRCGVQHFPTGASNHEKKNFAFKCHRKSDEVYPVNALTFHEFGTFATVGGDGCYTFWDKNAKQRLKAFTAHRKLPITDAKFTPDGQFFVYTNSYDWGKGHSNWEKTEASALCVHAIQEGEIQPRPKK